MSKPTKQLTKVLAKYSYKANPDRPGGFDELSIKQGEYIYFHGVNPTNPYWVKAENNQGVIGHVPAEYIMVCFHLKHSSFFSLVVHTCIFIY